MSGCGTRDDGRMGRAVIMSKDDLKARAVSALRRLQKLPDLVRDSSMTRSWHISRITVRT